jgi:hypothetical protein
MNMMRMTTAILTDKDQRRRNHAFDDQGDNRPVLVNVVVVDDGLGVNELPIV